MNARANQFISQSNFSTSTRGKGHEAGQGPDSWNNLSELIARGEVSFPSDLIPDDFQQLLLGVARRPRKWLVEFIANANAQDIDRSQNTSTEDMKDVEANI